MSASPVIRAGLSIRLASRVVADEFGVGLEMGQRLDLGALAADGRSGAADGQDDDEAKDDYRQAGYRYG